MEAHRILLLVVDEVEIAIDLMIALEDAGHFVEHVFHIDEAMLRARITKPDALVVAAPRSDESLVRGWSARHPDVALVLIAPSTAGRRAAELAGVPCLDRPVQPDRLVRLVERRIARGARTRRADPRVPAPPPPPSGTRPRALRLLVIAPRHLARRLDPELLRRHLGAACCVAGDTRAATGLLDSPLDAVLMDSALMIDPAAGVLLRQRIHAKGLPVLPVHFDPAHRGDFIAAISALRDAADVLHGSRAARR